MEEKLKRWKNYGILALTLMIAESEPREKGLMCAVVCRLLEE